MTLTVGSLFSGIGGFDLGLERAGMKVIWQSEIDPFACKVLKKHWPDVPNLGDINKIDWTNIERPDVICGGYPCQPFSTAGKRRGATDPRHLWPAMFNAICNLRPRYALMENVRGHLSLGFGDVLADLASIGFDAEWQVIPAAAVGAPHKRDRVFIVAYSKSEFGNVGNNNSHIGLEYETLSKFRNDGGSQSLADTDNAGSRTPERSTKRTGSSSKQKRKVVAQRGVSRRGAELADTEGKQSDVGQRRNNRTQSKKQGLQTQVRTGSTEMANTNGAGGWGVGSLSDGGETVFGQQNYLRGKNGNASRAWWQVEPDVGRVANGVSDRVDRLKGLGNAIVPQVAELVGALVVEHSQN